MYSNNPYSRSNVYKQEPNPFEYQNYPYQDYYQQNYYYDDEKYHDQDYQPQQDYYPRYENQQRYNYNQPSNLQYSNSQQFKPIFPQQTIHSQPNLTQSDLRSISYNGDGMITDIEYLDFPFDKTYRKLPIYPRTHEKLLNNTTLINKDPVKVFFLTLIEQLGTEKTLEELRKKLIFTQDFHPQILYNFFDQNKSQNIIFDELYTGFEQLGITLDYQGLQLVYTKFGDPSSNDRMPFQQFEQMFLPIGQSYKTIKLQQNLPNPQTRRILSELMKCYIQNEIRFENSKRYLSEMGVDYQYIFSAMGRNSKNIGFNDFMAAINEHSSIRIVPSEATLLFMRFDKSRNGTLSLMEFKREMQVKLY